MPIDSEFFACQNEYPQALLPDAVIFRAAESKLCVMLNFDPERIPQI